MSDQPNSNRARPPRINTQVVNDFYAESEKLLFECIDRALGASIDKERKRHLTVISIVSEKPRAAFVAIERWIRRAPVSNISYRAFKKSNKEDILTPKSIYYEAAESILNYYTLTLKPGVMSDKRHFKISPLRSEDFRISPDTKSSIKCGLFYIESPDSEYTITSQIDLMNSVNGYKVSSRPNLFIWVSSQPPHGFETLKTDKNNLHTPGNVFTILRIPPIFSEIVDLLYTPIDWASDKIDVSQAIENDEVQLEANQGVVSTFIETGKSLLSNQSELQIGTNYWALLEKMILFIAKVHAGEVVDPSYYGFLSTSFLAEAELERSGVPSRWLPDFDYLYHKAPTLFSSYQISQLKEIVEKLGYFRTSTIEEGRLSAVLQYIGSNPDFPFLSEGTKEFIQQNREVLIDQNIPKELRIGNTARLIGRLDKLVKKPPERIVGLNNWVQFAQFINGAWQEIVRSLN